MTTTIKALIVTTVSRINEDLQTYINQKIWYEMQLDNLSEAAMEVDPRAAAWRHGIAECEHAVEVLRAARDQLAAPG